MAKWSGVDGLKLPAQQVEPYRLWFEFLKLAIQDRSIKVKPKIYESWGNVENLTFEKWWSDHWRKLFAVDVGVYQVQLSDARAVLHSIEEQGNGILIRIPLYQDPKRSLAQVEDILTANNASYRLRDMPRGQFHITVGEKDDGTQISPAQRFLRNQVNVRFLMNFYKFWVKHQDLKKTDRIEQTTLSYFAWADGWNRKIREKKWRRPSIYIPQSVIDYDAYLKLRGNNRKRVKLDERPVNMGDQTFARRQVDRYITKALKIAANVGNGQFPGKY